MVNNNLKEIRMKMYMMTQSDFADFLEVPIKTYFGWENGKSRPNLQKALEIAKKVNKRVDDIWFLE